MIRPIVRDFLCKWPLRIGCMFIGIVGMIVAGLTLLSFVVYLSLQGKLKEDKPTLYFTLFMFLTAYQVVDFTFHLLLYFASKKGDIHVFKAIWIYLAVKLVVDVAFVTIILKFYQKMMVVAVIILVFYAFRIYFFIVVFSAYAVLLERKLSRDLFKEVGMHEKKSSTPIFIRDNKISPEELTLRESDDTSPASRSSSLKKHSRSSTGSKKSVTIMLPDSIDEKHSTARSSSAYIDPHNNPQPKPQ